jgi:DNA polymerase III epsilon subunit family exonuclease
MMGCTSRPARRPPAAAGLSAPGRNVTTVSIHSRLRRPIRRLWPTRLPGQFLRHLRPRDQAPARYLPARLVIDADVVVVDVETTGWLADAAGITEIGAVRLTGGQLAGEFSALVNPGTPIPPDITALTGITDDMVATAPAIDDVLPRFIEFASGSVIVAHNAPFDLGFLTAASAACGIAWPPCAVLDTAVLARLVLRRGEVADHKLATLSAHFGTAAWPPHRALADAKATAGVLAHLLRLIESAARRPAGAR